MNTRDWVLLLASTLSVGLPTRADAAAPTDVDVRGTIERGLAFLEKGGVAWMKERACASCHHVPFLLWSHNEARVRGFGVDGEKLGAWTNWALADTLARDPGDEGEGLETLAQLILGRDRESAWRRPPTRHHQTVDPYETLWRLVLDKQKQDGSFPSEGQRAFPADVSSSWALLALASRDSVPAPENSKAGKRIGLGTDVTSKLKRFEERYPSAREKALAFLESNPPDDSTEALALRLLVPTRDSMRTPLAHSELLARQRPDGGWAYLKDGEPSDAFATGLALYALTAASQKPDDRVVTAARRFLQKSQRPEGDWLVSSRSIHRADVADDYRARTDEIYGYWGTGWATIGLIHTLPALGERAAR